MSTPTTTPASADPPPAATPPGSEKAGWNAGRVLAVVFGSLGALIGLALLLAGLALVLAQAFARDDDGYYTSGTERLSTPTYAITVEDIDLGTDPVDLLPEDVLGRVRVRAERPGGGAIFVGIGPEREVDAYLRGVGHAKVEDLSADPPRYLTSRGGAPQRPPSAEQFWVASAEGPGRQAVSWEVEGGRWSVVAMNADGARRVVLDADVAAKVGWLLGVGIGLLVAGLLLVAGGIVLIVAAVRRSSRRPAGPGPPRPAHDQAVPQE
jgi:uncharacterized membrane protein